MYYCNLSITILQVLLRDIKQNHPEPANSFLRGSVVERQEETLKFIEPGQSIL